MMTFGKSLFLIKYRMRYMPSNTKDLAINQTMGCLWKPAKRNSVRVSKQLQFVSITETFNGNQALLCNMTINNGSFVKSCFILANIDS